MRSPFLKRYFSFLLLSLFYYTCMRIEFYFWNRSQFHQPEIANILLAFFQGIRFDGVTVCLLSAPLFLMAWLHYLVHAPDSRLFRRIWTGAIVFTFILNFLVMSLSLVDNELVNFTGKRFSLDTLFLLREISGKMGNFISNYWQLWIVNPLLVFSFLIFSWKILQCKSTGLSKSALKIQWRILILFGSLFVFVIGARGGLQMKPLSFVDSRLFEVPVMNHMVTNTGFPLLKSAGRKKLPHWKFFESNDELFQAMSSFATNESLQGLKPDLKEKSPNVVMIILESFSLEYMGLDGRTSYTPYLDSLAQKGLFFKNGFANGRRSIEGVGAILAGIPAWMDEPFISSEFATNQYLGIGSWFKGKGYSTSFFHGGKNGTMYFDSFTRGAGFNEYFGFNEYPHKEDYDGTWGVFDEPFLQFMVQKLGEFKPPFASAVFTLSSHQPYKVPDAYQSQFSGGPIEILKSVQYSDYALRKFFESAEKQPWFSNTLFILVADHTGRAYSQKFDHEIGSYQIPIIFYGPAIIPQPNVSQKVVSQIDIFPTIQDIFGQKPSPLLLGNSVFEDSAHPAVVWTEQQYLVIDKNRFLVWTPNAGAEFFERSDLGKSGVIEGSEKEIYEKYLKANLQKFSDGLYDNKLYYPDRK